MTSVTDIRAVTAFHVTHASFYPRRFSGRTEKLRRFEACHRLTTNSSSALGSTSAPLRQTDVWLCIFMYEVCGTFRSSEGPEGRSSPTNLIHSNPTDIFQDFDPLEFTLLNMWSISFHSSMANLISRCRLQTHRLKLQSWR
jgi:hypothetical protein